MELFLSSRSLTVQILIHFKWIMYLQVLLRCPLRQEVQSVLEHPRTWIYIFNYVFCFNEFFSKTVENVYQMINYSLEIQLVLFHQFHQFYPVTQERILVSLHLVTGAVPRSLPLKVHSSTIRVCTTTLRIVVHTLRIKEGTNVSLWGYCPSDMLLFP